jgi:hypothetical protein
VPDSQSGHAPTEHNLATYNLDPSQFDFLPRLDHIAVLSLAVGL